MYTTVLEGNLDLEMLEMVELLNWSGDMEQRTAEALGAQHHCWD